MLTSLCSSGWFIVLHIAGYFRPVTDKSSRKLFHQFGAFSGARAYGEVPVLVRATVSFEAVSNNIMVSFCFTAIP